MKKFKQLPEGYYIDKEQHIKNAQEELRLQKEWDEIRQHEEYETYQYKRVISLLAYG
jgi:hypothetical protein